MTPVLIGLALGMRHGTDPDHLTAIDGLSRLRPKVGTGVYFALGHGLLVTLLAVGVGRVVAERAGWLGPWMLILVGSVNAVKLLRKPPEPGPREVPERPVVAQPFLLGMLLAAGFETASQFSALVLAGETNPWLLGAVFTCGMILVDGFDGYLAASTQRIAATGARRGRDASRLLGILVVILSFGLGGAELSGFELAPFALPLGLLLFVAVISIRVWARCGPVSLANGGARIQPQSAQATL